MGTAGMEGSGGGQAGATAQPDWRARLRSIAFLLVMGCAWGLTFSLAKIATEAGAHPFGLSLWQAFFGGLFLLALGLLSRRGRLLDRRHLGFYLVIGLLGSALPGVLFYYAAPKVPAGVLSISVATIPILTFGAALALRIDRATLVRAGGLLLGILAVLLIVVPETSLPSPDMVPWVLLAWSGRSPAWSS
jgi:drug/metabolite transporter (DMT)-like permease